MVFEEVAFVHAGPGALSRAVASGLAPATRQLRASSLTQPRAGAAAGSQENRGILFSALALSAPVMVAASVSRSHRRSARTRAAPLTIVAATAAGGVEVATGPQLEVPEELNDIGLAGVDIDTPHWSVKPMEAPKEAVAVGKLDWANLHSLACVASGVLFLGELVRFVMGIPPSDAEVYFGAVVYAIIYSSRFEGIKMLPSHFRVTFYATTGWTVYYIAHMLAATNPVIFFPLVYPAGVVFLASTVYFYKHWLERMYRHFVEDRFRPYYVPGLMGLMYFHGLDTVDLFNQWIDPQYWEHVPLRLPDQAWTIQDVRLTGLFMSSMALFMITLHNKKVLTGGQNTLLTVLFTIFVPALFLTGTHANLQASFP
mmetsp:Transcript_12510/g.19807  ORF Transcript_12510/g.19807 Transcript_12510/m.19807 type:complete len:370 (-) Transcript_12510:42-1151(-)